MSIDDLLSPPHHFKQPIRSVAVIGSGATGTPAAKHLQDAGLRVKVFERQKQPGGIWNWDPEVALPLSVPTPPPSRGAFTPVIRQGGVYEDASKENRSRFSPTNPCYASLTNNVPTETMAYKSFPWPEGTESTVPHYQLATYIHSFAKHFGVDKITSYSTRVEKVEKRGDGWRLYLRKVVDEGADQAREEYWTEDFDAVIVATGHYNAPYIPQVQGADVWSKVWKDKVIHSQGYRTAEPYEGKNVLIVGAGTSGVDIAKDLETHSAKTYLVGKDVLRGPEAYRTQRNWQRNLVPANGELLREIQSFHAPAEGDKIEDGVIELTDGRKITGISVVIFATGYQYSYPFLSEFHRDPGAPESSESLSKPLVTDGSGVLNLYRDVFYIPDPTLTFIGLSVNTAAFNFFEYQSISIARVFSGKAHLPNESNRWRAYEALIAEKGEGKFSHLMNKDGERKYVRETVEWLNRDAQWSGADPIEGHTPEWLAIADKSLERIAANYGIDKETAAKLREPSNSDGEKEAPLPVDGTASDETNRKAAEGLARKAGVLKV